jgi:hypothetical protein
MKARILEKGDEKQHRIKDYLKEFLYIVIRFST